MSEMENLTVKELKQSVIQLRDICMDTIITLVNYSVAVLIENDEIKYADIEKLTKKEDDKIIAAITDELVKISAGENKDDQEKRVYQIKNIIEKTIKDEIEKSKTIEKDKT